LFREELGELFNGIISVWTFCVLIFEYFFVLEVPELGQMRDLTFLGCLTVLVDVHIADKKIFVILISAFLKEVLHFLTCGSPRRRIVHKVHLMLLVTDESNQVLFRLGVVDCFWVPVFHFFFTFCIF
jgi:hypothetical protein